MTDRHLEVYLDGVLCGSLTQAALVFNMVAGCTDAHAKNYSIMLEGRSVRLAPLYDLLSYAAYWDGEARIESAMSVGGEYALSRISAVALAQAGARFGIGHEHAAEIVDATRRGILGGFESARAAVEPHGTAALNVADELLRGLRRLPLVLV